ncbi:UvrD-helicase domain-containing protein [Neobacillus drentensis]|uniref:UvrD-helicase domain-containing protein n=1 Tax=Neobacillus drentensis TaxID=220684 RepID=UPI002FFDFD0E
MTTDTSLSDSSNKLAWDAFLNWITSPKATEKATVEYEAAKVLYNITLTQQQADIVLSQSKHLLIRGAAGSGKSLALLSRMIGRMLEEENGRYLYISYNNKLVQDMRKQFTKTPYLDVLQERHNFNNDVWFKTFHDLVKDVMQQINKPVPRFETTPRALATSNDSMFRQMHRLLVALDTEEFQDMPPIHKIKGNGNAGFLRDEFLWMKANNYLTEEDYIKCERVGRGNLPWISREQRRTIFKLFQKYCEEQKKVYHDRLDSEDYALKIIQHVESIPRSLKFDHIFIDEAQDLQPMQLYALTLLTHGTLTICGDDKQKIYKSSPYSYRKLNIDIDRSNNYMLDGIFRSTKQIMKLANSLKFERRDDDKGEQEIYNKNGSKPNVLHFRSYNSQIQYIVNDIRKIKQDKPEESVAVIHRFGNPRLIQELKNAFGRYFYVQRPEEGNRSGSGRHVYVTDAHPIKGLEFDHVYIINFDKNTYPLNSEFTSLERYNSDSITTSHYKEDRRQIIDMEKRVLYVALTRARKRVTLTYHGDYFVDRSPFIVDFNPEDYNFRN